jgi:hypothetical protein
MQPFKAWGYSLFSEQELHMHRADHNVTPPLIRKVVPATLASKVYLYSAAGNVFNL